MLFYVNQGFVVADGPLRLTGRELAAAGLLVADGGDVSDVAALRRRGLADEIRVLEEGGLVVGGQVPEAVIAVVRAVHRPRLRVLVEVVRSSVVAAHAFWVTPEVAVLGRWADADARDYSLHDPVLLPVAVAGLVGLGRRASGPRRRPLTVSAAALDTAGPLLEGGNPAGARRRLMAAGQGRHEAGRTLALLAARRLSWRAASQWVDRSGALRAGAVTVVDAGAGGLWRSTTGGGSDPWVTLTPVTPSQVWCALSALLPAP